jgi:transposase
MPRLTGEQRTELANRLNGGQPLAHIAAEMGISVKTVYRLKTRFQQEDGIFEALAPDKAPKRAFNREELVQIELANGCTTNPK